MLITSGGVGKKIYLGEDICVMVESIDIKGKYISLEINAKSHIWPICNESYYHLEMLDKVSINAQRRQKGARITLLQAYLDDPVFIGDDVTVKVIDIQGIKAVLGFVASPDIIMYGEELFHEIQKAKQYSLSAVTPGCTGVH